MRFRLARLGSLGLALLLLAAVASPVAAKSVGIYDQGSWDNPFTDTFCGFNVEGRESGPLGHL